MGSDMQTTFKPCPTGSPMCRPDYATDAGLGADLVRVACCCGRSSARHSDCKQAIEDWNAHSSRAKSEPLANSHFDFGGVDD